jgi:hypothetical protein
MTLRQNYFSIPAVDSDFLREVARIYTAISNIGRDAPASAVRRNYQPPPGLVKTQILDS